jgi:hypothetical protein
MQRRRLQVTISFEPNRLAEKYVADVYEKLIPITKYSTDSNIKEKNIVESEVTLHIKEIS